MSQSPSPAPLSRDVVDAIEHDVVPSLRERLIAELDRIGLSPPQRLHYLSEISVRALQTVMRWIAKDRPGLPDSKSLALLCLRLDVDANWMLGLTRRRMRFPFENLIDELRPAFPEQVGRADWIGYLNDKLADEAAVSEVVIMRGDDMAPLINDGCPIFVDTTQTQVDLNGIYVLDYDGRTMVRHVETRIGEGMVLRCENERYGQTVIRSRSRAARLRLKVIGKVLLTIDVRRL